MELKIAERKQVKMKLSLQGPSGSGKSYSALLLAFGLCENWSKIAVVDTENHSAHLYSHLGDYMVLNLAKPYTPERYIEAIETCENAGMQVIVIDSISHEWSGESGVLEIHSNMVGNSFTNWAKVTPRHNAFVQKMLQSPCHIIGCLRTKQDYVLSEKNGKLTPERVGLQAVTREDLCYEFTLLFEIDIKHYATVSKDRTGLFSNKPPFIINTTTGTQIKDWCMSGFKMSDIEAEIDQCTTIDGLRHILLKYQEHRKKIEPSVYRRKAQIDTLAAVVNP